MTGTHASDVAARQFRNVANELLRAQMATSSLLGSGLSEPGFTHARTIAATLEAALVELRTLSVLMDPDLVP
jgi:hypothetical protein